MIEYSRGVTLRKMLDKKSPDISYRVRNNGDTVGVWHLRLKNRSKYEHLFGLRFHFGNGETGNSFIKE